MRRQLLYSALYVLDLAQGREAGLSLKLAEVLAQLDEEWPG